MKLILKIVFFAYVLMFSSLGSTEELSGNKFSGNIPPAEKPKAAWERASDHAINNKSVGIAIYGHAKDASSKVMGEHLKKWFADRDIKSTYFISEEDRLGVKVGFYIREESFGPGGLDEIPGDLAMIVRDFEEIWQDKDNNSDNVSAVKPLCKNMHKCTRKEAFDASADQIMFHYNEKMRGVRELAATLTEHGFTAVALPGYDKEGMGQMRTAKSKAFDFTQEDINFGKIGSLAKSLYKTRVTDKQSDAGGYEK